MSKLNRVVELFALAALVLVGHPDTALAQLTFTPNSVALTITGPGQGNATSVNVTSTTATVTGVTIGTITASGPGGWLCATHTGTTGIAITVGGVGCDTTPLTTNTTYSGTIQVTATTTSGTQGPASLFVSLQVGGTGGTNGLVVTPNPLAFTGSSVQSGTVTVTYGGSNATLNSITSITTGTGQSWLGAQISNFQGVVSVTVNPSVLTATSSDSGTVSVSTSLGLVASFTVTLNGGGNTFGLVANPNPLNFSVAAGASPQPQNVNITYSGNLATLNGVSVNTTTGQNWLSAFVSGTGIVTVNVNSSFLSAGTYNGNVFVTTQLYGSINIPVTLNDGTGGSSGLTANPNPMSFVVPAGSTTSSQNASITYNFAPTPLNSVSTTTGTGQSWLSAQVTGTGVVTVTVNPFNLAGSYSGTVFVSTQLYGQISFTVNLSVGGTNTSGLVVNPSQLNFNIGLAGSGAPAQSVSVTFNGMPIAIQNISTTAAGQVWPLVSSPAVGTVTVGINGANLQNGSYSTTVTLVTTAGMVNFNVNLTVGGTGGSTGLVATPNPVTFNLASGSGTSSLTSNITNNGIATTVTGVSVTTGQSWLQAFISGTSSVTVSANPFGLSGPYTGIVQVSTSAGTLSLQVNLTVGTGGTSGLVANPSVASLTAAVGQNAASQNVSITYNNSAASITNVTSSTSTAQNWLVTNFSFGTVTVSANSSFLTAGSYSGTVTVTTTNGTLTFTVNLTVGGTTVNPNGLIANPSVVNFTESTPGTAGSQTITVTQNGVQQVVTSLTFVPAIPGLTFINYGTNPDGTVTISVNGVVQTAGFYQGTLTLYTINSATSVSVPVSLTFGSGTGSSGLAATPNPVNFSVQPGGSAPSQNVSITFNGAATTISGVSATTSTGQNWLQAGNSGQGGVTVTVNAAGLSSGVYTGTVTVTTSAGALSFQVNVTVGGTATLTASAQSLNFAYQTGASNPPAQTVTVTSNGSTAVTFNITPSTTTGGPWLVVFPSGQATTPATLTVSVQPGSLAAGTYTGNILIQTFSGSTTNSSLNIPINLVVSSSPALSISPSSLTFNGSTSSPPTAQTLTVSSSGTGLNFTVSANVASGAVNWLQAQPLAGVTPSSVTVSANPQNLAAGTYTGTVTFSSPGAASGTVSVPVTFTVSGGTTGGGTLTASPSTLSFAYQTGGTQPPAQTVAVGGQGGFNATVNNSAATTWLGVTPGAGTAPGSITVSVNAIGLTDGSYVGTIAITPTGSSSSVTVTVTLTVGATSGSPTPTVVSVNNAASNSPTALSPGLNIDISGSNMGPTTVALFQVGPNGILATTVAGTTVTFDNIAAPIILTSANLVSVMVPYELDGKTSTVMVATYNGVASTPLTLRVVPAAPGIFTDNQTGSGQGAIRNQDGSVNGAGNPEMVGNVITIFLSGEGQTTPAGVTGAVLPNRLPTPAPVLPVSVTIGGIPATISSAGEAPGLVSGVLQVNAMIPPGVGSGAVPIVVGVGSAQSQANVTVAVQ